MNTKEILQGIKNWTTGKLDTKADKSSTVSNAAYDTTNRKITQTIDGITSDVVTAAKIVGDGVGTLYDAEIEYLESTGTQYIDTEHIVTQDTEYECVGELTSIDIDSFSCMFGYHVGSGSASQYYPSGGFCLFCNPNVAIQARTGVHGNPNIVSNTNWAAGVKHTFILKANYLTIDGNTFTSQNTLYSNPISTYIFSAHDVTAQNRRNAPAKIYRFLIRENNILVHDFIPVRVGQVGYLYDKVSGRLFGNAGTGDFVLGQDTGGSGGSRMDALTRHTRLTDFDLNVLKQAVADQNLEKYGLKVGDQKTINGHTYVIAGLNCMKGTHAYTCTTDHVGLIVIPHTTQKWNASGSTAQGADDRGAGYMNSDLHYYLKNTLLPLVETDLGAANLLGHSKLLSNAVTDGKSSNWTWETDCKICALSETQVYGATVWSSSGYDTGEACRQLDVFQKYSHTEIFREEYIWLRDVVSASSAALADHSGISNFNPALNAHSVAALILFH